MKKTFTKFCLLALAMIFGGVISANAQIVTWNVSNKTYAAGDELSPNTSVVSVKLGETTLSWLYNSGRGGITTYIQGSPTAGGSYIVVKPVKDITFKLDTWSSMSNCNLKMYEESATTTILKDFRQKGAVSNDFGTLSAGKTYYIYGEGFRTTAAAGTTNSNEYIFYKKFVATTVETYTINYIDAENNVLKAPRTDKGLYGTTTTATTDDMAAIEYEGITYAYASGNATITLGTTNTINLVFEKSAAAPTTYTIKYELSDGTAIADPIQHKGLAGDENVSATNEEVPTYITKNGIKYKYVSGNTPITLEEDENSNIITLVYAEATKYVGKVIAVDNSDNVLGEIATLPAVYEGDSYTYAYPQYYLSGTTLYNVANNGTGDWFRKSVSPTTDNFVIKINYNGASIANVAFYTEAENIAGVATANYTNRASNGKVAYTNGAENYKDVTTLAPGKYIIYTRSLNGNNNTRNFNFKVGDNVVWTSGFPQGTDNKKNSDEITVSTTATLSFASEGSTTSGIDWMYIVKTGDYTGETITVTDRATYVTPAALDFTGLDVKAYVASAVTASSVTLTQVNKVAANEAIVLLGNGTVEVPTFAGEADTYTNNFVQAAAATEAREAGKTIYAISKTYGDFRKVGTSVDLPEGKAYLAVEGAAAIKAVVFDDDATAADVVEAQEVATPANGKFIMNGKLVIVKDGIIYNVAGMKK